MKRRTSSFTSTLSKSLTELLLCCCGLERKGNDCSEVVVHVFSVENVSNSGGGGGRRRRRRLRRRRRRRCPPLCSLGRDLRSFHIQLTRPSLFFRFGYSRAKSGHVSSMCSIQLLLKKSVLCFESLFDLGLSKSCLLFLPGLQLLIQ